MSDSLRPHGLQPSRFLRPWDFLGKSTGVQSTSFEMPGWMKHELESRLLGEISITSDMQMTPPLWQKVKRNWRASWQKWKRKMIMKWSENRSVVSALCDPLDYTVHGILQARILEWVAFLFSRRSSQPRDRTQDSHNEDRFLKAGLKLNIPKTNILASGPITSRQIDGETKETVRNFIFLGSKITAGGDCSHEIACSLEEKLWQT